MATAIPDLDAELDETTKEIEYLQSVFEHWVKAEAEAALAEDLILSRQHEQERAAIGTPLQELPVDHQISGQIKQVKQQLNAQIERKRLDCYHIQQTKEAISRNGRGGR